MDWLEFFKMLGFTTGGPVLLLVIIGFWGKKMIEYFYGNAIEFKKKELEQELQLHKQRLEQENNFLKLDIDKNLESYKNRLEILKLEYQVQFSKLHEKRSVVIENLYQKLVRLNYAMLRLTAGMKPVIKDAEKEEEQRLIEANDLFFEFQNYYSENKIYFQPDTCEILEKLKTHYWNSAWDYMEISRMKSFGVDGIDLKESFKKAKEAGACVREEVPKVLFLLESEFRLMLGVSEAK
jgi:hypothetical protein